MAALGIDGLVSGLNTTSIISQLMQLEAQPQAQLKSHLATTTTFANDLRSLNTGTLQIRDAAKAAAAAGALDVFTAKSSVASVTATASTASAGNVSFTVTKTAQAQTVVSKAMAAWQDSPPVLTLVKGGKTTEITAASTSLSDVVAAINKADAGITATQVSAGKDAAGNLQYRLQITGNATGAANSFTLYRGAAAGVGTPAAVDLAGETGAATTSAASDAEITLWPGTLDQKITSSTNTFTGVVPGLDLTVSALEATPVTVGVTRNGSAASAVASNLISTLSGLFSTIAAKTATTTTTDSTGRSVVKGGSLTGDSTVRQLKDALLRAATDPVGAKSPSSIGITITRDGTVTFDSAAFTKALTADPAGTAQLFRTIAGRVQGAATGAADPYNGYLTTKISGQDSTIKSLNDQISSWDGRLAQRKDTLQKQYTALETALGTLKSQSSWLTSQLANLSGSSTA
jgi:flagellar hook-associated protein 2